MILNTIKGSVMTVMSTKSPRTRQSNSSKVFRELCFSMARSWEECHQVNLITRLSALDKISRPISYFLRKTKVEQLLPRSGTTYCLHRAILQYRYYPTSLGACTFWAYVQVCWQTSICEPCWNRRSFFGLEPCRRFSTYFIRIE